jgi:hypothetical protein
LGSSTIRKWKLYFWEPHFFLKDWLKIKRIN